MADEHSIDTSVEAPYFLVNCGSRGYPNVMAKISPQDAEIVLRYKWQWTRGNDVNGQLYVRSVDRSVSPPVQIKMHRLITGAPPGTHVDHINHDTLDNRRENLRVVTPQLNQANSRKLKPASSRFKGVSWHKQTNKWRAYIAIDRRQIYLGLFDDEIEAARTYDEAAKRHWGGYAYLNLE